MNGLHRFHTAYAILCNGRKLKWGNIRDSYVIFCANNQIRRESFSTRSCISSQKRSFCLNKIDFKRLNTFFLRCSRSITNNSVDNQTDKALEDDEFKDLLKDFAKDFGVSEDSLKILEDIKKEQEQKVPIKDKKDGPEENCDSTNIDVDSTLAAYRAITKNRYKIFDDKDASVIYSYEEEAQLELDEKFFHIDQEKEHYAASHVAKRGVTGVYDVEELVAVLREEKLMDIAVIKIPKTFHYADYLVLATARSPRHSRAVSEFIVKFYKRKKDKKDPFVGIEGEKYGSWSAIDMGNIVFHLFLEEARACYDIESLWLLDNKYDTGGQVQKDEFSDMMQEELEFFNCLQSTQMTDSNVELTK